MTSTEPPQPTTDQTPVNIKKTTDSPKAALIVAVVLLIIIILGALGYFSWKKINSNTKTSQTADQIRQTFTPSTPIKPTFVPPNPGTGGDQPSYNQPVGPQPVQPNSGAPVSPRGSVAGATTPPNNQGQYQQNNYHPNTYQAPPAQPLYYHSDRLGFSITLPAGFVAKDNGSAIWFYLNGAPQGYIEAYQSINTTLSDVQQTLQNSSSVKTVSQTTINGQPALQYTAYNAANSGLVLITNGQIYYFHGIASSPSVLSTFVAGTSSAQPPASAGQYYNP